MASGNYLVRGTWAKLLRLPTPVAFPVLIAVLFFSLTLTPSLMPRAQLVQGAVGGVVAAVGYMLAVVFIWCWRFIELPIPSRKRQALLSKFCWSVAVLGMLFSFSQSTHWQNATRSTFGLAPLDHSIFLIIGPVAVVVFLVLWIAGHSFQYALALVDRTLERILPKRISLSISFVVVLWIFWAAIDGLLVRKALDIANKSFEAADTLIAPDMPPPSQNDRSGSSASLIDWQELGGQGRDFISTGPSAQEISSFSRNKALEPIRVYVGRRSAETFEDRAELALKELIRVGGFDRSTLIVIVPTGTGWMDPNGQDPMEFMLGGDVATVAVQYSYLTSFLSLATNPEYGTAQAHALFDVIYDYWTRLPRDSRPRFYVHGLSQGAFNSQSTLPLLDLLRDPIDGALWVGSPFLSPIWKRVRADRQPDSPSWRPRFGNSSLIRTMNQRGLTNPVENPWGPIRLIFLNYPSDPIVVFDFDLAFQRPDWLRDQRPPDVAPKLIWFPLVTMFQIALDMTISLKIPGYGHYYIARDYIDAWAGLLELPEWSTDRSDALKAHFENRL